MFKELLGFPPLEFFNAVETITTEGKTKIHNVLYFTNNTKDKIKNYFVNTHCDNGHWIHGS